MTSRCVTGVGAHAYLVRKVVKTPRHVKPPRPAPLLPSKGHTVLFVHIFCNLGDALHTRRKTLLYWCNPLPLQSAEV